MPDENGRNCETPTTKPERVASDGRYWIQARGDPGIASTEYQRFFACVKDQFQAHPYLDRLKAQDCPVTYPTKGIGIQSCLREECREREPTLADLH